MPLEPFQKTATITCRFALKNVPIILDRSISETDPRREGWLRVLNGLDEAVFPTMVSPDLLDGTAEPKRPQEVEVVTRNAIRSFISIYTDPETWRSPNLVIEILSTKVEEGTVL